jgi:hypothetical protein
MFRALARLFGKDEIPKRSFWDPLLGEFAFERGIGWKKQVVLQNRLAGSSEVGDVELILGSDGDPPPAAMVETARSWMSEWARERPKIINYIRSELQRSDWSEEPDLPQPELLQVEAIHLLWDDSPQTSVIYFHYLGDDIRYWHVTFDGFNPRGLAYDD